MNQRNYQKELDKILDNMVKNGEQGQKLLLHSCCAPCSSYCLEYLSKYFEIIVFYYNPNITLEPEYRHRVEEQKRLIATLSREGVSFPISVIEGDYEPAAFLEAVKGLEKEPEGGVRCEKCFRLRLAKTAKVAKQEGADYFTTTLTISPLKNAPLLNEIGEKMASNVGVKWLPTDFKKKNGYKRSVELSAQYDLYRQDYCGCSFSKAEAMARAGQES